jgi:hypothetical protein
MTTAKKPRKTRRPKPPADAPSNWHDANQAYLVAEFARLRLLFEGGEPPPAIDQLESIFGLTPFERDVLLLCAGIEMDSPLASRCAELQGASQRTAPTFSLALAALPGPHWSALTPAGALRRFRLVEIDASRGFITAPLRIDERILHFLAGINQLDPRLASLVAYAPPPDTIAEEHSATAEKIAPLFAGAHRAPLWR